MNRQSIITVVLAAIACTICVVNASATTADSIDSDIPQSPTTYIPDFHGTLRIFYELSAVNADSRFMVRNARLSAGGVVLPQVDYYLQADFSDKGKFQLLDAYVRLAPRKRLKVMAGQMRVPFSAAASRSPHSYYFINRSFLGKYAGNLRSVGVKAAYTFTPVPLYVEGGVFNGTSRSDHSQWNSAMTYSIKVNLPMDCGLKPEIGFMSRQYGQRSEGTRINQFDVSLNWHSGRWTAEAEYILSNCTADFPTSHQYSAFLIYDLPVDRGIADIVSFGARFDGHTDATDGFYEADGTLPVSYPARKRLTLGVTSSYIRGKMHMDLRLNYEQYFYHDKRSQRDPSDDNKLAAALILYF